VFTRGEIQCILGYLSLAVEYVQNAKDVADTMTDVLNTPLKNVYVVNRKRINRGF
jgi:hypothetical protein